VGRSKRHVILVGESITLLEGSQASPARPSGKGRMNVKTLGWQGTVA
jgi:hypothetical protein